MIHEYALEPELVASWHDRMFFRFFIEQFGFGTGRVVSRYPKRWRRLVWNAFQAAFGAAAGEIERKRVEEMLARLTAPEVRRPGYVWDEARGWLENAERENDRRPFHAIVARDNPRGHANILRADDILAGTPDSWRAPHSAVVDRTAECMAQAVAPMLRCASHILFVDPHFRASREKYRNTLRAFLRVVAQQGNAPAIELHTGHVSDDAPDWETFKRECERYLLPLIPAGLTLVVRRWKNKRGGERLHNRYILTDVGGIQFGVGLDEGDAGTRDDVTLLDAEAHRHRLDSYRDPVSAFDLEGEIRLTKPER